MFELFALALGVLCVVALVLAARGRARARNAPADPPPSSGLPPISMLEAQQVIDQAREAAREKARGGADARNPFAAKTRAHILWETEYQCALMEWTQPRR